MVVRAPVRQQGSQSTYLYSWVRPWLGFLGTASLSEKDLVSFSVCEAPPSSPAAPTNSVLFSKTRCPAASSCLVIPLTGYRRVLGGPAISAPLALGAPLHIVHECRNGLSGYWGGPVTVLSVPAITFCSHSNS